MKKLYFLTIALFFVAITQLNAQDDIVFGFNTDGNAETWEAAGADATVAGGVLNLAFTGSYPKLVNTVGNIDADTYRYVLITLKNNSNDTFLRFSIPKDGGRIYFNADMSTNDTEFKTYLFDLTNDNWTGTVNDLQIQIKKDAATVSEGVGSIDFDEIRFMAELAKTEKLVFDFETDEDLEGWNIKNGSATVSGGFLTFVPKANKYAKLEQLLYTVDADVNQYFTIVCKNESTDDDMLRIIYAGGNYDIPLSMEDTYFRTYSVRIADSAEWAGVQENITIGFRDTENVNGVGKSSGTGNLIVESIEFSPGIILATEDLYLDENPELLLYPSPVNNILNIRTKKEFARVDVIDLTGKTLISVKGDVKTINVADLSKGIYLLKMQDISGENSIKRFLKN